MKYTMLEKAVGAALILVLLAAFGVAFAVAVETVYRVTSSW